MHRWVVNEKELTVYITSIA